MREREMTFPETTTGDIGLGLYLLTSGCRLVKVEYVTDRYVFTDRLVMTFTGMNINLQEGNYHAGSADVDLSRLPELFDALAKHPIAQTCEGSRV
jgi:hypothetical protein